MMNVLAFLITLDYINHNANLLMNASAHGILCSSFVTKNTVSDLQKTHR